MHYNAQVVHDETPQWSKFGPIELKVAHGHTEQAPPLTLPLLLALPFLYRGVRKVAAPGNGLPRPGNEGNNPSPPQVPRGPRQRGRGRSRLSTPGSHRGPPTVEIVQDWAVHAVAETIGHAVMARACRDSPPAKGVTYLNFYVKHLGRAGFAVGGLLGEDDHGEAATPSAGCRKTMSLAKHLHGDGNAVRGASVATAMP